MKREPSVETLWNSAPPGAGPFRVNTVTTLPDAARRYLTHAIAPDTPLASAVRLRMHGEIKRKGWLPFRAEQVIRTDGSMIWTATVRQHGIPIRGFDRLVDGEGAMQWKLLGIVPVVTASGRDITRSAVGRVMAESVWLPSMLCGGDMSWTEVDPLHTRARRTLYDEPADIVLTVDSAGRLQSVRLSRWGNPNGAAFRYADFGGTAEAEATFDGYTIPTRLTVGWNLKNGRFESDGEFFRVTIDDAQYR